MAAPQAKPTDAKSPPSGGPQPQPQAQSQSQGGGHAPPQSPPSNPHFKNHPIRLVEVFRRADSGSGVGSGVGSAEMRINPDAESALMRFPANTLVLVLTGVARTGKSKLASYIVAKLAGAFGVDAASAAAIAAGWAVASGNNQLFASADGDEHCTHGIWMFGCPLPLPGGRALLLLDCQGTAKGDDNVNFALCAISALLSSVYCVSTQKLPGNHTYQSLKEIGAIMGEFERGRGSGSTASAGAAVSAVAFPSLVFRATDATPAEVKTLPTLSPAAAAAVDANEKAGKLSLAAPELRSACDAFLNAELKATAKNDAATKSAKEAILTAFPKRRLLLTRRVRNEAAFTEADARGVVAGDSKLAADPWHRSMIDAVGALLADDVCGSTAHALTTTGFEPWLALLSSLVAWGNAQPVQRPNFLVMYHLPLAGAIAKERVADTFHVRMNGCDDLKAVPNEAALHARYSAAANATLHAYRAAAKARGLDSRAIDCIELEHLSAYLTCAFAAHRTRWLAAELAHTQQQTAAALQAAAALSADRDRHRQRVSDLSAAVTDMKRREGLHGEELKRLDEKIARELADAKALEKRLDDQLKAAAATTAAMQEQLRVAQEQLRIAQSMPPPPPPRRGGICSVM